MISLPKLVRLAASCEYSRMLDEIARNGRPLPLRVRLRLEDASSLPAAALGLALQRVIELTYRPTETSITLLDHLLDHAQPDGAFGSLAATAVALAAVHATLDQLGALALGAEARYMAPELESRSRSAAALALHYLSQAQRRSDAGEPGEPLSEGLIGDEIDSAITLWQLGFDARFTGAVRYEALLAAVEDRGLAHDRAVRALFDGLDPGARRHNAPPPSARSRPDQRSAA